MEPLKNDRGGNRYQPQSRSSLGAHSEQPCRLAATLWDARSGKGTAIEALAETARGDVVFVDRRHVEGSCAEVGAQRTHGWRLRQTNLQALFRFQPR